ncbi:hypothetical protein L226DRAFT_553825 [Lentinus tigrinus ALCF2SS1-7]|uniref:Uncharacterized protein n=1 Tax=Lentinus tigrinus ALCF2SS1-6 TaxID=1328759 RepID=A0A5C2SC32_9APHY|nr:hypothetical protein L227DRAFT_576545 [Lentinus tigrinus ALCF2SS1-6]RPD73426.1 hypothetical protein L226DRAFT_553825 [Lentinus tigrinus ALCF2SS1-7]
MGSAQSYIPVATLVVAGAAAYGYAQLKQPTPVPQGPSTSSSSASSSSKKQKHKKKTGAGAGTGPSKEDVPAEPSVVSFPPVIPGDFDAPSAATSDPADRPAAAVGKPKKKKKAKKASPVPVDAQSESSATAPESSAARRTKKSATPKPLDDDGWTRVETKKKTVRDAAKGDAPAGEGRPQLEVSTSDAGITTSATGNSSPVTERTEDESALADSGISENRRTLAERLLPKPRKTGVEDLLEEPDYPQLARVMRIKPRPDEQPAAGFSWGDYEDVDESRGTADDADGEDDGGWGVVKSRGRPKVNKTPSQQTPTAQKAPETLTKKQRQHAAKREAQKAAKADAEAERLATLAQHKRELERARMVEQAKSSKKTTGGGMSAYVDENGKLVWQ